jgi:hypothetical protein
MSKWISHHKCECGFRKKFAFDKTFFAHDDACPKCGEFQSDMELVVERWVSLAKWWNPLTWSKGYWVPRPTHNGGESE